MKISIITATYNSAATVRDTIESVLRQTYQDVEYIVKDGGSTDDTLSICQEYETQFKGRMRIISCPDKGLYDAMNVGIEVVRDDEVGRSLHKWMAEPREHYERPSASFQAEWNKK